MSIFDQINSTLMDIIKIIRGVCYFGGFVAEPFNVLPDLVDVVLLFSFGIGVIVP